MERTFEAALVEQCAPTLAGVKPASLFRWQGEETLSLLPWARELAPFGIALRVLKTWTRTGACLIYLYRAGWLHQILAEPSNQDFLQRMGYRMDRGCGSLLEQLSQRLCRDEEFPHEIGVFLGYPLEDVEGFMEHHGQNYTCCGCWKAYGDPQAAQQRFACYRCCTAEWMERFQQGERIVQLIPA